MLVKAFRVFKNDATQGTGERLAGGAGWLDKAFQVIIQSVDCKKV